MEIWKKMRVGVFFLNTVYLEPIGSRIWEIDWYQNEWPRPLFRGRIKVTSPLRYITRWISRKPLEIEVWFQRTTDRKWPIGYRMVTWPWKVKLVTPIRLERNISKTTWARDFKFGRRLCMGMPSRRTNNFPECGRGLGYVTPTIFGSMVVYPSDSLASCKENLQR